MKPLAVFVVDDATDVRERIVSAISEIPGLGTPEVAGSVEAAREVLRAHKPDVVLLDLRLPDGSGLEILREMRARGSRAFVAILTAFDSDQMRRSCFAAGANAFLSKTSGLVELPALLSSITELEVC